MNRTAAIRNALFSPLSGLELLLAALLLRLAR